MKKIFILQKCKVGDLQRIIYIFIRDMSHMNHGYTKRYNGTASTLVPLHVNLCTSDLRQVFLSPFS